MKTVVAHDGTFHPDDVFAVACIQLVEGAENVVIKRTRIQSEIDVADWVVDVGAEYDPERLRFDHHQIGAPVRDNGIQYAAFGLVWKHYGEKISGSAEVAKMIEEKIVWPIDMNDVGQVTHEISEAGVAPLTFFDFIDSYQPAWGRESEADQSFVQAVEVAREYLVRVIAKMKARLAMFEYANRLYESAEDKRIIVSDRKLSTGAFKDKPEVIAVMSPRDTVPDQWVVAAIPSNPETFEYPVKFPESWRGLRDEDLAKESGIKNAVFCHKGGHMFIVFGKENAEKAAEYLL